MTIDLKPLFFSRTKKEIDCVKGHTTNEIAPRYLALSSHHVGHSPAKLSGVMKLMDLIFSGRVYAEYNPKSNCLIGSLVREDKGTYNFCATQVNVKWEKEESHIDFTSGLPMFLYITSCGTHDETRDLFNLACEQFKKKGQVDYETALQLCDSVYYSYCYMLETIEVFEHESDFTNIYKDKIHTRKLSGENVYHKANQFFNISTDNIPEYFNQIETASEFLGLTAEQLTIYEDVKMGAYILPYEWDEESQTKIPPLSILDNYYPIPKYFDILKKISYRLQRVISRLEEGKIGKDAIGRDFLNINIHGKPGTGKSKLPEVLMASLGLPYEISITSDSTDTDEYEGKIRPCEGIWENVPTPFQKRFISGGACVVEEYNLGAAGILMGSLGQALESPFVLMKNGYETVNRHPLFICFTTMNPKTAGTKKTNSALSSRLKFSYKLDDPSEDAFLQILKIIGYDEKLSRWTQGIYKRISERVEHDQYTDLLDLLSLRSCEGVIQSIEEGISPKEAVRDSITNKLAEKNEEYANELYESIVEPYPDLI